MTYKDNEIIDLRAPSLDAQGPSAQKFEEDFMKFAHESEAAKLANEAESTPKAETDTRGTLESNIGNETAQTNHTNLTADETVGMHGDDPLGTNTYRWGEKPPVVGQPGTTGRRPDIETVSSSAEQINNQDNLDMLARSFNNFSAARQNAQETVSRNLEHGQPGTYVTRSKTLLDKVKGVVGRH